MRIADTSAKIMDFTGMSSAAIIEKIGRICYKSEDNIKEGSDLIFCKNLIKRNHGAMLEHAWVHVVLSDNIKDHFWVSLEALKQVPDFKINEILRYVKFFNPPIFDSSFNKRKNADAIISASVRTWIDIYLSLERVYNTIDRTTLNKYGFTKESWGIMCALFDALEKEDEVIKMAISENFPYQDWHGGALWEYMALSETPTADYAVYRNSIEVVSQNELLLRLKERKEGFEFSDEEVQFICDNQIIHTAFITTDRGISHDIVRHRACSFAQESTRWCNYSKDKFGSGITLLNPTVLYDLPEEARNSWKNAMKAAEEAYNKILEISNNPDAGRIALPHSTKVDMFITTYEGEWKHILGLRFGENTGHVHPHMKEMAIRLRDELKIATDGRVK